ncbi:hypothetical protein FOCC_FOCC009620 [Frankliniella occidentalis]|nr:hypothetical protein FOCC_FOCC009620 [Frankliniella occidentalis]
MTQGTSSQLDHVLTDYPRVARVQAVTPHEKRSDHRLVIAVLSPPTQLPFLPCGRRPAIPPVLHPPRPKVPWALRRLTTDPALQAEYTGTLRALLTAQAAHHRDPLTWAQLVNALRSAADGVLQEPPSPQTPRRQAAANSLAGALTAHHRAGRGPYTMDRVRLARTAQRAAYEQHSQEKHARLFAQVDGTRPPARLHAVFRYLRVAKRAPLGGRAGEPTLRDWQEAAVALAEGEPVPRLPERPDQAFPPPTAQQLHRCAKELSSHSAAGPDGLNAELYKYAPAEFFEHLASLVAPLWEAGTFPKDWLTSVQQPIPKVPRPRTVEEYRTLTLGNAIYKILARYVLGLLVGVLPPLPWYQAGFQPQRGTYDHILVLRKVLDERWRAGDTMHVLALDLKSAFPSVHRRELAAVLLQQGVPPFLLNRVTALGLTDYTSIRWRQGRTHEVRTGRGVKQGCSMAPYLYTRALHWAVAAAIRDHPRFDLDLAQEEFEPLLLAYADDLLVASPELQDLLDFLHSFVESAALIGQRLNFAKCEYLVRNPYAVDDQPLPRPVQLGEHQVRQVSSLVYLGALVTTRLDRSKVVHHRITKAHAATAALQTTLRRHPLPLSVVARIFITCILPALAYAQATAATVWTARASLRRQASIMVGGLLALARRDRGDRGAQRDPRLHGAQKTRGSITRAVWGCRLRYWAHIRRTAENGPLQRVLRFDLRRRKQGRPCHTFSDTLMQDVGRLQAPPQGWEQLALDKVAFGRHVAEALCDDYSSEEEAEGEWDPEEHPLEEEN